MLLRGLTDRKSRAQQGLCWELSHREPASRDSEVQTVGLGVRKPTGREKAATTGSWAPKSVDARRKELLLPLDSTLSCRAYWTLVGAKCLEGEETEAVNLSASSNLQKGAMGSVTTSRISLK